MRSSILLFPALLFLYLNSSAQTPSLNESPIEGQFEYVYKNSNDYEDYKVVKRWQLIRLKDHVMDTLQLLKGQIQQKEMIIAGKQDEIDSLVMLNTQVNDNLHKTTEEKNTIYLLGISFHKSVYNSIVWSLIGILSAGLLVFVFLFNRSNRVTVHCRNDLGELKDEFEAFRKRALEREESVARRYHDELIKYKERAGKIKS